MIRACVCPRWLAAKGQTCEFVLRQAEGAAGAAVTAQQEAARWFAFFEAKGWPTDDRDAR